MKKINKKGFSLAEILIALGIISVIATMGFTIAKKGIDKAYDMYIYTSYVGLSDALTEAHTDGFSLGDDLNDNINCLVYLDKLLSTPEETSLTKLQTKDQIYNQNKTYTINAKNGVTYTIKTVFSNNIYEFTSIKMELPARKTQNRTTGKRTVCYAYNSNGVGNDILKTAIVPAAESFDICVMDPDVKDLVKRMDLLPFYIDDGDIGKLKIPAPNIDCANCDGTNPIGGSYKSPRYYPFKEAACRVANDGYTIQYNGQSKDLLQDCSNISEIENIVIKVANPRKVF